MVRGAREEWSKDLLAEGAQIQRGKDFDNFFVKKQKMTTPSPEKSLDRFLATHDVLVIVLKHLSLPERLACSVSAIHIIVQLRPYAPKVEERSYKI